MRAILRSNVTPTMLERALSSVTSNTNSAGVSAEPSWAAKKPTSSATGGKKMAIFYGSNTGTCEALAQRLARDVPAHGFQVTQVDSLDSAKQALPKDRPVVIITAAYEGEPPDNAAHFVTWLRSLKGSEAESVAFSYSVATIVTGPTLSTRYLSWWTTYWSNVEGNELLQWERPTPQQGTYSPISRTGRTRSSGR